MGQLIYPSYLMKFFFIDGKYYITVRAINKMEYGGPLATSVCHSTAYAIDNSPPIVYEIFNVQYDEETFNLTLSHNSSYVLHRTVFLISKLRFLLQNHNHVYFLQ